MTPLLEMNYVSMRAGIEEVRPRLHERPPFFERVAPPVGPLRRVADDMGERGLGDLAREMGFVSRPVAKGRTEAIIGHAGEVHSPENHFHRHDRNRPTGAGAGKDEISRARPFGLAEQVERSPGVMVSLQAAEVSHAATRLLGSAYRPLTVSATQPKSLENSVITL